MLTIEKDLRGDGGNDRFCHQFILGPEFVDALRGWQRIPISDCLKLTIHPEVPVTRVEAGQTSITIIGYILDPLRPEVENELIGQTLLSEFSSIETLVAATARYGGRWIILAKRQERSLLFNDAMGLRQVFYSLPGSANGLWLMSQPGILAWHLGLKVDSEAESFMTSLEVRGRSEYRWPGTATAFREIRHLLPNHYLDLDSGKCHRFWPNQALGDLSLEAGIEKAGTLLKGLMDAASRRFDLVLGMTAGLDSRVVLAAAKGIRAEISAVTVRQGQMSDSHQDIAVASRLLGRVGISHAIVRALPWMSGAFSKKFKQNVFFAHDHYGPDVEALLDRFSRTKAAVTGSGAEVAREPFRKRIDASKGVFTASDLASLQYMDENKFAMEYFSQWLEDTGNLYNVHLLDVFAWEQSHGNWLAGTQMEFDLAWLDIFTPFNCRELMICLLSVEGRHRISPDYKLFVSLIENLWPELLAEPINPDKSVKVSRLRETARSVKKYLSNRVK